MNRKDLLSYVLGLMNTISNEYSLDEFDLKYSMDKDVLDCQFKLYIVMLINDVDNEDFDERWNDFVESYNKLSLDKQEFIKQDFINIIKKQDENNKKKEKIL